MFGGDTLGDTCSFLFNRARARHPSDAWKDTHHVILGRYVLVLRVCSRMCSHVLKDKQISALYMSMDNDTDVVSDVCVLHVVFFLRPTSLWDYVYPFARSPPIVKNIVVLNSLTFFAQG